MLDIYNKTSCFFEEKLLLQILKTQSNKEVELIITDNKEIQNYNKNFRKIDKHTDVLSFPMEDMPNAPLGSIVISYDWVKKGALEYKHSEENELTLLFIHGLLHLVGFDHEIDNGEMRDKEESIIKKFNLPSSLIIRESLKT